MAGMLSGRDFLKISDFTPDEIRALIDLSATFKAKKRRGEPHRYLEGKNIVLLFEKTSTRTRNSFEVAGRDLGMGVVYVQSESSQMGIKESIPDTARVLSRIYDGIEYRGYSQSVVEELAAYADVPVWNGLTDEAHPTQMIADMLTVSENFPGGFEGLKFVFMGDARNNVANSLLVTCAMLGMDFVACGPRQLMPMSSLVEWGRSVAERTGGSVSLSEDPVDACRGASVIYTDIWVSMGEPFELWEERIALLSPYRVTAELMALGTDEVIFLHCLPAYHDARTEVGRQVAEQFDIDALEVTDEVFESNRSRVFDEAENRMHSIKAIMYATLASKEVKCV